LTQGGVKVGVVFEIGYTSMDLPTLRDRLQIILSKRESLKMLMELPRTGTISIDIQSALAELDELVNDIKRTFPDLDISA